MNEELYSLPNTWAYASVGEVSRLIQYGYTQKSTTQPVGPRYLRITDIQNGLVDWDKVPYCEISTSDESRFSLHSGDILFARSGATAGKTFLVKNSPRAVFASYLIRVQTFSEVLPDYLYAFLNSRIYWDQLTMRGNAQPNANAKVLARIKLPLAPFSEQRRIVSELFGLRARTSTARRSLGSVPSIIDRFRESLLRKAFRGELRGPPSSSGTGKELLQQVRNYKSWFDSRSGSRRNSTTPKGANGEFPSTWMVVRLGEVCSPTETVNPEDEPNREFQYIDIASIDNHKNVISTPKAILGHDAPSRARQVARKGDILFSTVRTYLRNVAMVTDKYDNEVCSTGFCVIRPMPFMNPEFIFYYVLTDKFISDVTPTQTGILYPATKDSIIFNQRIPVPAKDEQVEIVSKVKYLLSNCNSAENASKAALGQIDALEQIILSRAFRGELVPRGPTDESASVLLERIRAQRLGASKKEKSQTTLEIASPAQITPKA